MNTASPHLVQRRRRRLPHVARSFVRCLVVAAVLVAAGLVGWVRTAPPARACPVTASCTTPGFTYGHSWYVQNLAAIGTLAQSDAAFANSICAQHTGNTDFLTVLDFGRPGKHNLAYSMFTNRLGGWVPLSQVEGAAEVYATQWYAATTSCPRLHLVIGTANDYQCYNSDSDCSVYTAGQKWAQTVYDVQVYLSNSNYAWQETAWAGDDIEGEWDPFACSGCWPQTRDFLNGFTNQNANYSPHALLLDYGDATYAHCSDLTGDCSHKWSPQNIYDASWGIGWDVPLPETYGAAQTDKWNCVYHSTCGGCPPGMSCADTGGMLFWGVMTECSQGDPLPTGNCLQHGNNNQCEWSAYKGYNTLAADVNQPNIAYATNIRYQNDPAYGNGTC
jgi:hypothetical protein